MKSKEITRSLKKCLCQYLCCGTSVIFGLVFVFIVVPLTLFLWNIRNYHVVNWDLTIPDGFHGYIGVKYNCPGGTPIQISGFTRKVEFNSKGLFCTSSKSPKEVITFNQALKFLSGNTIPEYRHDLKGKPQGIVWQSIGVRAITPNLRINNMNVEYEILAWVGESTARDNTPLGFYPDSLLLENTHEELRKLKG